MALTCVDVVALMLGYDVFQLFKALVDVVIIVCGGAGLLVLLKLWAVIVEAVGSILWATDTL